MPHGRAASDNIGRAGGTGYGSSLFFWGKRNRGLDEEVEEEEEGAKEEEVGHGADAGVRNPAKRAYDRDRDGAEAGLFAEAVEGANFGMAGEAAAEQGEFFMDPSGEDVASAPDKGGPQDEQAIAEDGKNAEIWSCSPIHGPSRMAEVTSLL